MAGTKQNYQSDVIIIGGGLAGIVTAFELLDHKKKVIIFERDEEKNFGGLAKESFGGVMMVDTPLQRRLGIRDNPDLALSDWFNFARFGKDDVWPRKWAETYVSKSLEMIYEWLVQRSVKFLPVVNWPERGLFVPGNSVPRWHIAWGTGYGIIESLLGHLDQHPGRKNLRVCFNHQVSRIIHTNGSVTGCEGVLGNGETFSASADALVAASGGICGGDLSRVRKHWYKDWGDPPDVLLNGSHRFADGMIHDLIEEAGGNLTHLDKHWHYAAGIHHPKPDRKKHGLSLVPPRSALWVNALGERIGPVPLVGYTDTRYLVEQICKQPGKYSWQILNQKIALKELAVSGSDYMTAFRYKKKLRLILDVLFGNKELVNRLINESGDVVTAHSVPELVQKMNETDNEYQVDAKLLESEIRAYDDRIDRGPRYFNDDQLRRIANFRTYRGDRIRTCKFQKINDPKAMSLIAIREFILSRKSLGGAQTDLECRVLNKKGEPIPGLYAVGETAGFGGGGIHGLGSLEGTFLGSCVLTGRMAGMSVVGGQ
ncbi:FAD-binding dehydrogenase [Desulfococcaceae bacterium HSG8]|nr:FAD-binding dehydrogenase [Desulfococcaceae bacterium HSG8]